MKLDLKGWQKIKGEKDHTVLRNKDGHELKVYHRPLSAKTRGELAELPTSMAKGGKVQKFADGGEAASDDSTQTQQPAAPVTINIGAPTNALPDTIGQRPQQAPGVQPFTDMGGAMGAPGAFQPDAPEPAQKPLAEAQPAAATPTGPAPASIAPQTQAPGQAPSLAPQVQGQDPFGTTAYYNTLQKGIGQEMAGIQGQAAAESQTARAQAAALQQQVTTQQQFVEDHKRHYEALEAERQNFQKDLVEHQIDPNRYWGSLSTGQHIAKGIGIILGGIGGGLTGGSNPALNFLNQQIDRDIAAQRANLGTKETLLSANLKQFGNLRDAEDMTRVMMADTVSNQIKLAAAKSGDQMAKSRALIAAGAINQKYAPQIGQTAARQSLLDGVRSGHIEPAMYIRTVVPEGEKAGVAKEAAEAQNLAAVRDNTLSAFDKIAQINTVSGRTMHPIDASRQIDALRGAALDKLTKDTSGRVTPETVQLISGLFPAAGSSSQTNQIQRQQLTKLLTQGMHFPLAEQYIPRDVLLKGQYSAPNGQSRFKEMPPVLPSK